MNNNDVFKKLRVALQLRDEQIIEILKLVDFNIGKPELNAFFRAEDHPNFMECGDQVLRNFLNGLVIHLRGTKENPKVPTEMAKSAQKIMTSDFAIATTGNAGPTKGDESAELGTVFIAVATPNEVFVEEFNFGQPREKVIDRAVSKALELIYKEILKK